MFHRAPMLAALVAAGPRPPTKPLTGRQEVVLTAIEAHIEETGSPPTERELAARLQVARTVVHVHVQALFRKGWVVARRSDDGRVIARTMVVVRPQP